MYNALPCFVCARSIVFCQNFLPDHAAAAKLLDWGGKRFSLASRTGTPPPLYVSPSLTPVLS